MKSPELSAAAELLDVHVPASRASWLLVVPVFLLFGIAGGLIVMIGRAIRQGIPQTAFIACAGLMTAALALVLNRSWQRRIEPRAMHIVRDNPDAPIKELITLMFGRGAWVGATLYWFALARALPKHSRVGVTIRSCLPKHTNPVEPITVTFEPRLLDEADESVVALENATGLTDKAGRSAIHDYHANKQPSPAIRRLTRTVRLGGGWLVVGPVSIILVVMLWETLFSGRISSYRMISLGILFVALASSLFASPQEWLVVPGGILIRKGRRLSSESKLRLFDRRSGVLIVHRLQKHHWLICVADANEAMRKFVTAHEATLLLRAWLSPIPPPPLERLSELGQSD